MKRPWQVWLTFACCVLMAVAAMVWLTVQTLRVDRQLSVARAETELEQRISLILWRMDTKLAPIIVEEIARPQSFYKAAFPKDGVAERSPYVLLNFEVDMNSSWSSPQLPMRKLTPFGLPIGFVPQPEQEDYVRLDKLAKQVGVQDLVAQLPDQPLPSVREQSEQASVESFYAANQVAQQPSRGAQKAGYGKGLQQRNLRYQDATQQEFRKQRLARGEASSEPALTAESVSRAVWIGDKLLLARRVVRDSNEAVQGSWLNWTGIKKELLTESADLVPDADLVAVENVAEANPTRMLAGLPVQLVFVPPSSLAAASSPIRWALYVGWGALLLAVAAVAVLLRGVVALSERRAAFVSSVTHEMRTPLTTFRMYSEMLAQDMVPDPQRRREYLETLRSEADRLTHLVENVLSYARLERGRGLRRGEQVTAESLVERLELRLKNRAEQADMQLTVFVAEDAGSRSLTTDVGVVEQILFNLVDNAAKYAAGAEDRRIHWEVNCIALDVEFVVRDHGPGFSKLGRARRFVPFGKSAEEAAVSAPGVGLGLALCRRLAKQLGGRLEVASGPGEEPGATARLVLPADA